MLLLFTWLVAAPPDLASKLEVSAELWSVAEAGGAACRLLRSAGVATGHVCQWPDGTVLSRAEYADGYRHFLYFADGAVHTECVYAEGRFDCAEWTEDGRRLSPYEAAVNAHGRNVEVAAQELARSSEARAAFSVLVRVLWQAHAAAPERIRAATLLQQLQRRRLARAEELTAMGFLDLEIVAILREEERGGQPVDARPLFEREHRPHAQR